MKAPRGCTRSSRTSPRARAKKSDLALLEELAQITKDASLCGLGQTAGNPILTTLRYFRHEYEAHILDKSCPAGVCTKLIRYVVLAEKCTGCLSCKKACPTEASRARSRTVHSIIQTKCIKCGACREACRFEAIEEQREEAIQII